MSERDVTFKAMGCEVRLIVGEHRRGGRPADRAIEEARRYVAEFEAALSRFNPDSELSRLNADPRPAVPASRLLRAAIHAGLAAAQRTGGLVEPTLVRALEAAGYAESRADVEPAPLREALLWAPPRRPARPHPAQAWRAISIDDAAGVVHRPPGLAIDTGGVGKGLAADVLAQRLEEHPVFVVDCGGDIRIGGREAPWRTREVRIEHPLSGRPAHSLMVGEGAIATSGVNVRVWRTADGGYGHHLIDPSTGAPAWTGLIGATSLGRSVLEAETLSKAALLSGPARGRRVLARRGGLLFHDDGTVEPVGPLSPTPRIRVVLPSRAVAPPAAA